MQRLEVTPLIVSFSFSLSIARYFPTETGCLKIRGANHRTLIEAPLEAHRSNATAAPDGRVLLIRLRLNKNLADFDQPVVNTTQIVCDCFYIELSCSLPVARQGISTPINMGEESQIFLKVKGLCDVDGSANSIIVLAGGGKGRDLVQQRAGCEWNM
jgi:hypothetical protein